MDVYGPLPSGEYLLVLIDRYCRYPEVEIIKSTRASGFHNSGADDIDHDFLTVDESASKADEKEVQNASNSSMHEFWRSQFETFAKHDSDHVKTTTSEEESFEQNRYYMSAYFEWLKKKLPFITLWGNLCLGDLKR
eukprot:gene11724-12945_t